MVIAVNLPIGILCGIGFAIYLLEEMMDPHPSAPNGRDKPPSHGEDPLKDKPASSSRSSDSKGASSSSSSSSKRTLSESEKAALPTSTGKNKDKDKSERLPVSPEARVDRMKADHQGDLKILFLARLDDVHVDPQSENTTRLEWPRISTSCSRHIVRTR